MQYYVLTIGVQQFLCKTGKVAKMKDVDGRGDSRKISTRRFHVHPETDTHRFLSLCSLLYPYPIKLIILYVRLLCTQYYS